jgi:hypothetical protein
VPWGGSETSCGDDFDLREGDTLAFANARVLKGETPSCAVLQFDAEIDGVAFTDNTRAPTLVAQPFAIAAGNARVHDNCEGAYTLSIMPLSAAYLKTVGGVPSDHALVREFSGRCAVADPRRASCWDSWSVRVTDAAGAVVTKAM